MLEEAGLDGVARLRVALSIGGRDALHEQGDELSGLRAPRPESVEPGDHLPSGFEPRVKVVGRLGILPYASQVVLEEEPPRRIRSQGRFDSILAHDRIEQTPRLEISL